MSYYPHTVAPDRAADYAVEREAAKEALLARFRDNVAEILSESLQLGAFTFKHGPLIAQLRAELNDVEVALLPDGLQASRKGRKNVTRTKRAEVFGRDNFTCQKCSWRAEPQDALTQRARRGAGKFLTIDHVLPESEGGSNHIDNLQTLCTVCNGQKGRTVDVDAIRAFLATRHPEGCADL